MQRRIPIVDYLVIDADPPHLRALACVACDALYLGRRNGCSRCGAHHFSSRPLATTGRLRTFTIVHRSAPGVPTPYSSLVVDLDGGGSVRAGLVDEADHPTLTPGMRLRLATFDAGTDDNGTVAVGFGFVPDPCNGGSHGS